MTATAPTSTVPAFELDGLNIALAVLGRASSHADSRMWGRVREYLVVVDDLLQECRNELDALLTGDSSEGGRS